MDVSSQPRGLKLPTGLVPVEAKIEKKTPARGLKLPTGLVPVEAKIEKKAPARLFIQS